MQLRTLIIFWIVFVGSAILSCKPTKNAPEKPALPFDPSHEQVSHRHRVQELAKKHHLKTESQWDSLNHFKVSTKHKKQYTPHPDYKVLGWHMYSNGSAYKNYNFSILSGIIYFSYEVDPKTGKASNNHSWKTTALADSAKANKVKLYLAASNFGGSNNHTFLTNPGAQKHFIQNMINLLEQRHANGVVLDFENINGSDRERFAQFIARLSTVLKSNSPAYECLICLYAIDYQKVFDIKSLNAHVDTYILMGYDYYGSFSSESGPVAPLHDFNQYKDYSLEYSINSYLAEGVPPKNLILGLPYYGAKWEVQNQDIPSGVIQFSDSPAYSEIEEHIQKDNIKVGFNSQGISKYYNEQKEGKNYQVWFDDSTTLSLKYDWAKYKKLGGVAPWIFSYGGDRDNLWQLLADKFGVPPAPPTSSSFQKPLSRASTLDYFLKDRSFMQEITSNFASWEHQPDTLGKKTAQQHYQVFGFYPFWNDNKALHIDFNLYACIGYFAALPDPKTGAIKNSFNWKKLNTKLPHKHRCKVNLVLASHNPRHSSQLLQNSKATQKLSKELVALLQQTGGDGIILDFGYLDPKDQANFAQFSDQLSKSLKKANLRYSLNCMLPPVASNNNHFAYEGGSLKNSIDYFLLTGFDYNEKKQKHAIPNAPLHGNSMVNNINTSVLKYTGMGIPSTQLILVVPYFGKLSETEKNTFPSLKKGNGKFISYSSFAKQIKTHSKRVFDKASATPCYIFRSGQKNFQTWIDDSASLALKFEYIKKNNLAGVGIWALGYDRGFQELTNTLIAYFGYTRSNKSSAIPQTEKNSQKLQNSTRMEPILWIIDLILVMFMVTVLLLSLWNCAIRSFLNKFIFWFYGLGFILFVGNYFLIRETKLTSDDGTLAIAAFIVVICLIWVKHMRESNARKNYP